MRSLLGAIVVVIMSAAPSAAQPAFETDISLPVPAGVTPDKVVLWAAGSLLVEHDVVISSETGTSQLVSMPATPPSTTAELRVSAKSRAESLYSAHRVTIDRAVLSGDARSAGSITLLGDAQVLGTAVPNTAFQPAAGPTLHVAFPAGSAGAVTVLSNASRILAPGRYLAVELKPGARLQLSAGAYYVESLKTAPDARITIDASGGDVTLYVRGNVEARGVQEVTSGSAASFLTIVLGTTATVERGFTGALIAPNAPLQLGSYPDSTFTGSFFARSLVVREHTSVRHVPSPLVWRPRIPFSDSKLSARTCGPFLSRDASGLDLHYVANPSCPIAFCDADEQPIATPTEAELNSTAVTPVTCPALAGTSGDCPIDPTTVTGSCTTSADCNASLGEVCGEQCLDPLCASVQLACGQLAASCSGLTSGGLCDPREWRECGDPLDRGTVSLASVQQQMYLQDGPTPSAFPTTGRATPPGTYDSLASVNACHYRFPLVLEALSSENQARDVNQTNGEWGVRFLPTLTHSAKLDRGDLKDGTFTVQGEIGLKIEATLRGVAVTPLEATAGVQATRCGVATYVTTEIFDQVVDVPELFDGAGGGLVEVIAGRLETAPALATTCRDKRTQRTSKAAAAKMAVVLARQVQAFFEQFGTSKDLCEQTKFELGAQGLPADCAAVSTLLDTAVPERWRNLYHNAVDALAEAERQAAAAEQAIGIEDNIVLADEGDEFDEVILHFSIGIGPLSLTVQLRAVGSYSLAGNLAYSLKVTGGTPSLVSGIASFPPLDGDVRATAGPTASAHFDASLVGFVGAGIPEYAAAGVEGTLQLIDATAHLDAVGALMLVSEPDPRDLASSDWAGDLIADIPINKVYRWVHGWAYAADAAISVLDGAIDLVARVGVDPFELSFRDNLVRWQGADWQATLVDGDPADMRDNFGASGDPIAMTRMRAPIVPASGDPNAIYPKRLFDPTSPIGVNAGCGGPN